jgi:hypothetical protein
VNEDATDVLPLDCQVGHQVGRQVGHQVGHQVGRQVGHQVGRQVGHQVCVFWTEKRANGTLHFTLFLSFSSLAIFNLTLYYSILRSLHIKIKRIAFIC